MPVSTLAQDAPARGSLLYDPKVRAAVYQVVLTAVVVFLVYQAATNAVANLRAARIASGFGFLNNTAGFDVNQAYIPFSAAGSTYHYALSCRHGVMTEETAQTMAALIRQLRHQAGSEELNGRRQGVYHLIIQPLAG